jgi:hypothetical protein
MNFSQEYLKSILDYDPSTGLFHHKTNYGGVWAGTVAGCLDSTTGYVRVRVRGKKYAAHRLAVFYMTGQPVPSGMSIDHINGDRSDNRFENLRICTNIENSFNTKPHKDNLTGLKGIQERKGKWRAMLGFNHKKVHLGSFASKEEAAAAYDLAAATYFKEFARPNFASTEQG